MEEKKTLSQYGIGLVYAVLTFGLTAVALLLNHFAVLPVLRYQLADLVLKLLGLALSLSAAALWFNAVITNRIAWHIRQNELVTSGAYAWVRNPIYSAIMLFMWGLLLWSTNLVLVPVYPLLITVLVKHTEERWLTERCGQSFQRYCDQVNRCFP